MKYFQMTSMAYFILSLGIFVLVRLGFSSYMTNKLNREMALLFAEKSIDEKDDLVDFTPHSIPYREKKQKATTIKKEKSKPISHAAPTSKKAANTTKHFKKPTKPKYEPKVVHEKQAPININLATKEEWMTINGIGEVFSTRILKFKDRLGGFYHVDQLLEVYGFPPETFEKIKGQLTCSDAVTKMNLKELEFKAILRHPYLEYEEVIGIKNYIRKSGPIDDLNKLMEATKKSRVDAEKLIHYIDIDQTGS